MIDKTISYSRAGVESSASSKEYINKNPNKESGYKLNIGDVVKGSLVQRGDLTLLQTNEGQIIPAKVLENIDFGKLLQFIVIGEKDGKFILELQNIDRTHLMDAIDKIITELKLSNNESIKQIIYKLLDNNLPLDKNTITKMYSSEKLYDLPIDTLINLNKNNSDININDIKNLGELKQSNFNQVIKCFADIIDSSEDIKGIKLLVQTMTDKLDNNKIEKSIYNTLEKELINDRVEPNKFKNDFKGYTPNNITPIPDDEITLQTVTNNSNSMDLLTKNNNKLDIDIIMNQLSKRVDINAFDSQFIKNLAKELIRSYISLDMKNLENSSDEARNTTNLHDKLESIVNELQKLEDTIKEDINYTASQTKSTSELNELLTSVKKYNIEGQYFCFPMVIKEEQRTGELYFFKPKKNTKSIDEKLYIVLALDMPNLNKIEVHIIQLKDNIDLLIKVKSEGVQNYLSDKKKELLSVINQNGFTIRNIEVKLLDTKDSKKYDEVNLYHLDIKA